MLIIAQLSGSFFYKINAKKKLLLFCNTLICVDISISCKKLLQKLTVPGLAKSIHVVFDVETA